MTVDIFQYSNMYTLRKSIQWLADEARVKEECGPYVIKEGTGNDLTPALARLTPLGFRKSYPGLAKASSPILAHETWNDGIRMDAGPRRPQYRHRCPEICQFRRDQGTYLSFYTRNKSAYLWCGRVSYAAYIAGRSFLPTKTNNHNPPRPSQPPLYHPRRSAAGARVP